MTAPCALCGRPGCRDCPLPPAMPPTPPDLPATCVVCGRTTVFTIAFLPLGTMIVCPGGVRVDVPATEGLCWWCWSRGWSLVRRARLVG